MASQSDYDQGGTFRPMVKKYFGPSVGWIEVPDAVLPVSAAGTTVALLGTTTIPVDCDANDCIIQLPKATPQADIKPGTIPIQHARLPITVYDAGGHATDHPITIIPADGETIMGLSEIEISVAYGGWTLLPNPEEGSWSTI